MMKIIFFGTPDFVIPIAQSLLNIKGFQLAAAVTNPDRPVGRHAYRQAGNQILTPSPIKSWATQHHIPVLTPNILDDGFKSQVSSFKFQVGILAAYGKIIPKEIIDLFPKGILVIHPSLLPKYRGASPVQAAILNGDQETGVSIIQMDEKMDHGPIVAQFKEKIAPDDTAGSLTQRLFLKTAEMLPLLFERSENFSLRSKNNLEIYSPPRPQNHSLATFTKLLTKDDGFIEWKTLASQEDVLRSYNFVRAMTPWPGAWTNIELRTKNQELKTLRLKILKSHLKVLGPKSSVLCLDEVQLEGKKPVSWNDFQKAYPAVKFS